MCQPYKASATALSDCYIDDEEIAKNFRVLSGFQSLAGPRNVSLDVKYDVLCL